MRNWRPCSRGACMLHQGSLGVMEDELRCPVCKQLFANPVLLPCYHALCLACALDIQTTSTATGAAASSAGALPQLPPHHHPSHHHSSSSAASSASSTASATESVSSDQDQADKVSILSEADSGVVCYTSRPASYAGTPNLQALLFPPSNGAAAYSLACPVCRKLIFFDEGGARNLPPYRAMESIVDRFCEREALRCQMCETEPRVASLVCEQCDIRYCDGCRELCHPARGPLAKHNLVKPRGASQVRESVCSDHSEPLTVYCLGCKVPACPQCMSDNRHNSHDVQPITSMCKAQKVNTYFCRGGRVLTTCRLGILSLLHVLSRQSGTRCALKPRWRLLERISYHIFYSKNPRIPPCGGSIPQIQLFLYYIDILNSTN